jgi:hypothetical protein
LRVLNLITINNNLPTSAVSPASSSKHTSSSHPHVKLWMSSSSSLAEDGRGKLTTLVDAFLHEDASRSQEDQLLFDEINQEEHLSIKTRLFEDESQLSRFLRACDGDCEAAWTELLSCARWYVAERPHRLSCEVCEHHFRQGKNYHNGHDKEGRPVIYMRMARDLPGDDAGKVKIMLYNLERSVRLLEEADSEAESVVWIVDCNGFSCEFYRGRLPITAFDFLFAACRS